MAGSYVEASYKKIPKASNFPDYKKDEHNYFLVIKSRESDGYVGPSLPLTFNLKRNNKM